jgi:hypothetical protein
MAKKKRRRRRPLDQTGSLKKKRKKRRSLMERPLRTKRRRKRRKRKKNVNVLDASSNTAQVLTSQASQSVNKGPRPILQQAAKATLTKPATHTILPATSLRKRKKRGN